MLSVKSFHLLAPAVSLAGVFLVKAKTGAVVAFHVSRQSQPVTARAEACPTKPRALGSFQGRDPRRASCRHPRGLGRGLGAELDGAAGQAGSGPEPDFLQV